MRRRSWWPGALAWGLAGLAVLSGVPSFWLLSRVWFGGSTEAAPPGPTLAPVAPPVGWCGGGVPRRGAPPPPGPPRRWASPRGRPGRGHQLAGRAVCEVRAGDPAGIAP